MQNVITTPSCAVTKDPQDVLLCVTGDEGWRTEYRLMIDATVIIGSSTQCGLSLPGDDLSRLHCSLRRDENGIWLKEWGSAHGTFLDGEKVTTEVPVGLGSTIRVGTYTVRLHFDEPEPPPKIGVDQHPSFTNETAMAGDLALQTSKTSQLATRALSPTASKATALEFPDLERKSCSPNTLDGGLTVAGCDGMDQENIDLLRAEVEQLQFELAERDAQLVEALAEEHEPETPADEASFNQLLERLEELLDELDRSDQRMATLEELLRTAEEANCDEREERRKMESWLGEIESVFGEREATWDAEMTVLRNHAATIATERDQLLQQLTQPALRDDSEQNTEDATRMHLQIEHLQQQLDEVKGSEIRHQEELRRCESQLAEAAEAKNALREQQLDLAEERASLSRLRAELAADAAERKARPQNALTDIDDRVRGFRQHLREIHEEEKQEHSERSMPSRIARLWKRIEGHQ
jgi:hypothetical protein